MQYIGATEQTLLKLFERIYNNPESRVLTTTVVASNTKSIYLLTLHEPLRMIFS